MSLFLWATGATLLAASSALACPGPGDLALTAETPGAPPAYARMSTPPLSAPFRIEIGFCDLEDERAEGLAFDAVMPAHQHGMNFRVDVAPLGENRFDISNVVFHMPGLWEIRVEVEIDGARMAYSAEVALE